MNRSDIVNGPVRDVLMFLQAAEHITSRDEKHVLVVVGKNHVPVMATILTGLLKLTPLEQ